MELARVSVLAFDVTSTVYASASGKRLASVMKKINKKIDRKNLNFGNKTAILNNILFWFSSTSQFLANGV